MPDLLTISIIILDIFNNNHHLPSDDGGGSVDSDGVGGGVDRGQFLCARD